MARVLAIASLLGLLGVALWVVYQQWIMVDVEVPAWGWVAIIFGGGLSLLVGFGLMALMFFSHRRGYDDAAHRNERIERDDP
jgi:hypothetical protein